MMNIESVNETNDINRLYTNKEFFEIYKNTFPNPLDEKGELMELINSYKSFSVLDQKPISSYIKELRDAMQKNPHNDSEFVLFGAALHVLSNQLKETDCLYLKTPNKVNVYRKAKACYTTFIKKYGTLSTKNMKDSRLSNELYAFAMLSNQYNKTPYQLMQQVLPCLAYDPHRFMLVGTIIYVLKHNIEIKIND